VKCSQWGGEVGDGGPFEAIDLIFLVGIGEEAKGAAPGDVGSDPGVQLKLEPILVGDLRVRGMCRPQYRAGSQQQHGPLAVAPKSMVSGGENNLFINGSHVPVGRVPSRGELFPPREGTRPTSLWRVHPLCIFVFLPLFLLVRSF
jgi:hypothetical protein